MSDRYRYISFVDYWTHKGGMERLDAENEQLWEQIDSADQLLTKISSLIAAGRLDLLTSDDNLIRQTDTCLKAYNEARSYLGNKANKFQLEDWSNLVNADMDVSDQYRILAHEYFGVYRENELLKKAVDAAKRLRTDPLVRRLLDESAGSPRQD